MYTDLYDNLFFNVTKNSKVLIFIPNSLMLNYYTVAFRRLFFLMVIKVGFWPTILFSSQIFKDVIYKIFEGNRNLVMRLKNALSYEIKNKKQKDQEYKVALFFASLGDIKIALKNNFGLTPNNELAVFYFLHIADGCDPELIVVSKHDLEKQLQLA